MATDAQRLALRTYARQVREARRAHAAVTEPGLAPHFQALLVALLPTLPAAPQLTVVGEFENPGVGRPDIALKRPGEPARAFVELKSADKTTDGGQWRTPHDKRQFARFGEFAHWAISNFHDFRLYERDKDVGRASMVPEAALNADRSDKAADRLVDEHDADPFLRLLERLAQSQPPAAKDAEQLAGLLAHSARLVRGIVRDRLAELTEQKIAGTALQQVRQEFRDVLYSHPEAAGYSSGDFDELFSGAFAQTLAFGLLLVREATGKAVDRHAADHMPPEHPLMKTALQVLSMEGSPARSGPASRRCWTRSMAFTRAFSPRRRTAATRSSISTRISSRPSIPRPASGSASTIRRSKWCATWSVRSTAPCGKVWEPPGFPTTRSISWTWPPAPAPSSSASPSACAATRPRAMAPARRRWP